jgi:hypothetical protein
MPATASTQIPNPSHSGKQNDHLSIHVSKECLLRLDLGVQYHRVTLSFRLQAFDFQ